MVACCCCCGCAALLQSPVGSSVRFVLHPSLHSIPVPIPSPLVSLCTSVPPPSSCSFLPPSSSRCLWPELHATPPLARSYCDSRSSLSPSSSLRLLTCLTTDSSSNRNCWHCSTAGLLVVSRTLKRSSSVRPSTAAVLAITTLYCSTTCSYSTCLSQYTVHMLQFFRKRLLAAVAALTMVSIMLRSSLWTASLAACIIMLGCAVDCCCCCWFIILSCAVLCCVGMLLYTCDVMCCAMVWYWSQMRFGCQLDLLGL
mmetsp:Transcript_11646/g.32126  ORF Transcript_11646/g.32126 Transcript_11646/m.32126 type:complete len:255 (-) Transcript_11646:143-907(-)